MSELEDRIATKVREWYEEHRETWIQRWSEPGVQDVFMADLIAEVHRVVKELTPIPAPLIHTHEDLTAEVDRVVKKLGKKGRK